MRIASIRISPVARIPAITYAAFGLIAFAGFAVGKSQYLTLPFGFVMPLVHLNVNFNLERSSNLLSNFFICIASILLWSATGAVTGAVAAMCFNLVSKWTGGIDAKYVSLSTSEGPTLGAKG